MPDRTPRKYLTPPEVASEIGCEAADIATLIQAGWLPEYDLRTAPNYGAWVDTVSFRALIDDAKAFVDYAKAATRLTIGSEQCA